ncbi:MAG: type VI secretion system contractile sheath large subunit [Gemmataceae bacterium]|nr:type VI secretion system contractile sheath large subunit [Gemmataceae bacterium]MCI0741182.1 type VI secretion system contractile sheath large subunit [Gemmataceae bacterium]
MAKSWNLRVGQINLTAGAAGDQQDLDPETPFRILVMGNFSGHGRRMNESHLDERRPVLIDRDNFEQVLARSSAQVSMPLGYNPAERMHISFRCLEDFEPDQLFQRLDVFESLRNLRRHLQDPAQFAAAAAEIKAWPSAAKIPDSPAPAPVSHENLLEHILGEKAAFPIETVSGETDWNQFLKKIVQPHLAARTEPRLADFEALVDEAVSAQMRAILHHPDFQALEAAWRGLALLVSRLETDERLQLYTLDVTKEELAYDLVGVDDLSRTGAYEILVEQTVGTPGAQPWAVTVGLYTFVPDEKDVEILANLAKIASKAGAPFLAAAHSRVLGCSSLWSNPDPRDWRVDATDQELWQELRQLPEANYLGLALPRFLLRLPYGKDFAGTEQFAFEEMVPGSNHDSYLWGNPAVACALLLGQSFSQLGWSLTPGNTLDVDRLPLHYFEEEGERQVKPCAEVLLSNRAMEQILDSGLMPFVSQKVRDAIRLARFQSVAFPPRPLAGRRQ